jgi:hypothetical protein
MVDLSTKTKSRLNNVFLGLLILVAVGVLGWFFAVKPILAAQEKKRFEKAAASLQQLADEIQAKIGKADEVTKEESCGRAHLKNDRGPLLCDTGYKLVFKNKNAADATGTMLQIAKFSSSELRKGNDFGLVSDEKSEFEFSVRKNGHTGQIFYQDLSDRFSLGCSASYRHEIEKTIGILTFEISCGNKSLAEHFPLRN